MPVARIITLAAVCLASTACGAGATVVAVQQPPTTTKAEGGVGCPLGVRDAQVAVEDTYGGVDLTFTSKDHTNELRDRTRDAAMMYGPGQRQGKGHRGTHGNGGGHGLQAISLPPAYATWQNVESGARIHLIPDDLADLNALRAKTRAAAQRMSTICD